MELPLNIESEASLNKIRVEIFQKEFTDSFDKQYRLDRTIDTYDLKSEENIKFYALYELYRFYENIEKQKFKIKIHGAKHKNKEFDLRYSITFKVYWNGLYHDTYLLSRKQNFDEISKSDFAVLIKSSVYIIKKQEEFAKATNKVKIQNKSKNAPSSEEPLNLEKLFNTIEFINKGIAKFPTPILYTGMTD